jgi:hypothetical protein
MTFRKFSSRDRPEAVARTVSTLESHLEQVLFIARRRAWRSSELVRTLLESATVEGQASNLNVKASSVTFRVPQLEQSWHQLFAWESLLSETPAETATTVAWSLRENIRRNKQALFRSAKS